jgi:hypothetical protein
MNHNPSQDEDLRLFIRTHLQDTQGLSRKHVIEKTYMDGSIYLGHLEADRRKGHGVYYYKN